MCSCQEIYVIHIIDIPFQKIDAILFHYDNRHRNGII